MLLCQRRPDEGASVKLRVGAAVTPLLAWTSGRAPLGALDHGGRTSSREAFLDAVRPSVAPVSCGHPSPFGRPYPEVVARYARRGITLRRTDLAGAVSVTLHPDGRWE